MSIDLSNLPRVDVTALPLYNRYTRSCRGYVGLKLVSDNPLGSIPSEWPEYLMEINPNIPDDGNYFLRLAVVGDNEEQTWSCSLINSFVKLVSDEVFQFQPLGEESILVWCETNMMARAWVQTICVVTNMANKREKLLKRKQNEEQWVRQLMLRDETTRPIEAISGASPALIEQAKNQPESAQSLTSVFEPLSVNVASSAKGLQSPRSVIIVPEMVDKPTPTDNSSQDRKEDSFDTDDESSVSPRVDEPQSSVEPDSRSSESVMSSDDDEDDDDPLDDDDNLLDEGYEEDNEGYNEEEEEDVLSPSLSDDWDQMESDLESIAAINTAEKVAVKEHRSAGQSLFILAVLLTGTYVIAALCQGLAVTLKEALLWPVGLMVRPVIDFGKALIFRKGWYMNLIK